MPNRLADATSPYLLQHADNPVDWYEWGPEALERARTEDRPIMISIGYAACHWCHVMAHESFEDPDVAAIMNERFVNIKIDREERPDLDQIYMSAVQAMTRHGGWPLTAFLTPDLEPFFGGTYFPPEPAHGMPSFRQVLDSIWFQWTERREDCTRHGTAMREYLEQTTGLRASPNEPTRLVVDQAVEAFVESFDAEWGGFGAAPKFPQPMNLGFLLRRAALGDARAEEPVRFTLEKMARGGIYDQLGGGFCRYSTDRMWLVPHFEKMLYDNAQLLTVYTRASQVFGDRFFATVASETADFLLRELALPDGGFASSLDADSRAPDGVMQEGAFYAFTYADLIGAAADDMPLAVAAFALAGHGNWEGRTVLWRPSPDAEVAAQTGSGIDEVRAAIERVRLAWFELRETRPRPGRDDKVLAGWNGLAIGALAEAGRVLRRPDLVAAAERCATFCLTALRRDDGRLMRSWREGRTSGPGFLDDHAFLADGLLTLYETTGTSKWYQASRALTEAMGARFSDERGGFHDTGDDTDALLIRPKDLFDNAVPSGNAAAAELLLRLAAIDGDDEVRARADAFLRMMAPALEHSPLGFGAALAALDRHLAPPLELAVVGEAGWARGLLDVADQMWHPNLVRASSVLLTPGEAHPRLLDDRPAPSKRATAYLCSGFSCQAPTEDPAELGRLLEDARTPRTEPA